MFRAAIRSLLLALLALVTLPALAAAQAGLGIRIASVAGLETPTGRQPDERWFVGGQIRLRGSRAALELSIDRHTQTDEVAGVKTVRTPFQTSLLLFMGKSAFAPYLLGGMGWYSQKFESTTDPKAAAVSTRDFGWHAGIGTEVRFGKRVAAHIDYRWTKVHFGDQATDTGTGGFSIPGLSAITDKLGLSSESHMWTTGLTFYF